MTHYQDATRTVAGLRLYLAVDRGFLIAYSLDRGRIWGRFNGEWWAA